MAEKLVWCGCRFGSSGVRSDCRTKAPTGAFVALTQVQYDNEMKQRVRSGFGVVRYFAKNILVVIGLVLIWRGIWYVLDGIDFAFFNGNHIWTAVGGIMFGLLILYIPDRDLKEIEKL